MFIYIYSLEAYNPSCQCFLVSLRQNTQKSCQRTLAWNLSNFHSSTYGSTSLAKPQPFLCAPALLGLLRSEPRMMPIGQSCQRNIAWVNVRYKLYCCSAHVKSFPLWYRPWEQWPWLLFNYIFTSMFKMLSLCVCFCVCLYLDAHAEVRA